MGGGLIFQVFTAKYAKGREVDMLWMIFHYEPRIERIERIERIFLGLMPAALDRMNRIYLG